MDRLGDARLRERLLEQETGAQAALAWMVAGAAYWYEHGFPALPELVVKDTEEWRREGDLIMAFADDRLTFGPEHHARLEDLFQAFGQWLSTKGHKPWTQKTFQSRFSSHDYITDRHAEYGQRRVGDTKYRAWWGVRLNPNAVNGMDGVMRPG
jgi:phage/plasmid-associated DNA primase